MTLSEFITENTLLWLKWNQLYESGANTELDFSTRAQAYKDSEKIVEQINKNISEFDLYLNNLTV